MTIYDFLARKANNKKLTMITCYDYWSASILAESNIDCLLVGDSLAMVMHGHDSTLPATIDIMALHIAAVKKGAPDKFIVGDMPFMSFRKSIDATLTAVEKLMQAGANCIKLEGLDGNEEVIKHIVESGVPVMGHLGLTPQSIHQLGGFKVQGREEKAAEKIKTHARKIEELGCFSVVLECVPSVVAKDITKLLTIPTIGIGAGPDTDGQVLVMQDMLGMNKQFKPKFLRHYFNGHETLLNAFNEFDRSVKEKTFPNIKESYE